VLAGLRAILATHPEARPQIKSAASDTPAKKTGAGKKKKKQA